MADFLMKILKQKFSWLYLITMMFFVVFCLVIAFSRFGKIRLGKDDGKPEYSTISWFAMLFGAGMGVGLVFWGVSEPLSHYIEPMKGITSQTNESARFAIRSCFMHWGVHPWACYAVMGLGLAYFQFRKKEKTLVSRLLSPLIGKHVEGGFGNAIDVYTTVLTVIGVATSFGMGCLQISGGLEYLFGVPDHVITWGIMIVILCFIYLKSAISGVGNGIKKISDLNLVLFVSLMLIAFIVGPKLDIVKMAGTGLFDYIAHFIPDSLRLTSQGDGTWIQNWRVFYWAWWLSWAPFVGTFIARISKGRTIREFMLGVMIVPMLVSVVWFSVFGGLAIGASKEFSTNELLEIISVPQTALFKIFSKYPAGIVLSLIAIVLITTFFITSANSATYVLAMLTSDGAIDPPDRTKVFWGILIAALAFALIVSGGVSGIQTIAVVIAFPYLFILLMICVSMIRVLREDAKKHKKV